MEPTQPEINKIQECEREVDELLKMAPGAPNNKKEIIARLEELAATSAKIAYGNGSPDLLSDRMQNLIAWTDHCDDVQWVERFKQAITRSPLPSPWQ